MKNSAKRKMVRGLMVATLIALAPVLAESQQLDSYQRLSFGLHFNPVISWFNSDIFKVKNQGARPGYNIGLNINKYFGPNYSFSTGISLMNVGGRLTASDSTILEFTNFNSTVLPGKPVIYKVQYLSIPLGLKLETNEIGYVKFFTDLGVDPKVVVGGKATISSLDIKNENASKELRLLNMGYHIGAGIDYSMGGTTSLVLGLRFENNFFDITKDNGVQPKDRITQKLINFMLGINF